MGSSSTCSARSTSSPRAAAVTATCRPALPSGKRPRRPPATQPPEPGAGATAKSWVDARRIQLKSSFAAVSALGVCKDLTLLFLGPRLGPSFLCRVPAAQMESPCLTPPRATDTCTHVVRPFCTHESPKWAATSHDDWVGSISPPPHEGGSVLSGPGNVPPPHSPRSATFTAERFKS